MQAIVCRSCILLKSIRQQCLCNTLTSKQFTQASIKLAKSHYDVLGITPKSTASDVKSAYYRLSMIYHPDKNEGCEDAAKKFRAITAAYEVLGNFRLRRLYDKGIIHTADSQFRSANEEDEIIVEEEEDAQTKFYKRHMKRTEAPHASGRTPIYNFDEWNDAHYGKAFARTQAARTKFNTKRTQSIIDENLAFNEFIVFGMLVLMVSVMFVFFVVERGDTDSDKLKKKNSTTENS